MTYGEMRAAVFSFYENKSRSIDETKDGLETLRDEIDMLIEALDEDANG